MRYRRPLREQPFGERTWIVLWKFNGRRGWYIRLVKFNGLFFQIKKRASLRSAIFLPGYYSETMDRI